MGAAQSLNPGCCVDPDRCVAVSKMGVLPKAYHPRWRPSWSFGRKAILPARPRSIAAMPTELYREPCQDGDGNRYTVIVWRLYPGLSSTSYTLDTGALVNYVDGRSFEIARTGVIITRLDCL